MQKKICKQLFERKIQWLRPLLKNGKLGRTMGATTKFWLVSEEYQRYLFRGKTMLFDRRQRIFICRCSNERAMDKHDRMLGYSDNRISGCSQAGPRYVSVCLLNAAKSTSLYERHSTIHWSDRVAIVRDNSFEREKPPSLLGRPFSRPVSAIPRFSCSALCHLPIPAKCVSRINTCVLIEK